MPIKKTAADFAAHRAIRLRRRVVPVAAVTSAAAITWVGVTADVARWAPSWPAPAPSEVRLRLPEPQAATPPPGVPLNVDGGSEDTTAAPDTAGAGPVAADAPVQHRRWWRLEREPGIATVQVSPGPVAVAVAGPGAGQVEVRVAGSPVAVPSTVDVAARSVTVEVRRRAGVDGPVEVWIDLVADPPR